MSTDFNILKAEYLSMRKEIEMVVASLPQLERNCVLVVAVAFTWAATQELLEDLARIAWLLPSTVPIYGAVRTWAIAKHLRVLASYVKTIEKAAIPDGLDIVGRQHFLDAQSNYSVVTTTQHVWSVLIV